MSNVIKDFLQKDTEKLEKIIQEYPQQIPVGVIAEWWGCTQDAIRATLEQSGLLGIGYRQPGKLNRGFVIPTGHFVRWYLCMKENS